MNEKRIKLCIGVGAYQFIWFFNVKKEFLPTPSFIPIEWVDNDRIDKAEEIVKLFKENGYIEDEAASGGFDETLIYYFDMKE